MKNSVQTLAIAMLIMSVGACSSQDDESKEMGAAADAMLEDAKQEAAGTMGEVSDAADSMSVDGAVEKVMDSKVGDAINTVKDDLSGTTVESIEGDITDAAKTMQYGAMQEAAEQVDSLEKKAQGLMDIGN